MNNSSCPVSSKHAATILNSIQHQGSGQHEAVSHSRRERRGAEGGGQRERGSSLSRARDLAGACRQSTRMCTSSAFSTLLLCCHVLSVYTCACSTFSTMEGKSLQWPNQISQYNGIPTVQLSWQGLTISRPSRDRHATVARWLKHLSTVATMAWAAARSRGVQALTAATSHGVRGFADEPGAPKKILAVLYKAGEAAKQPRMLGAVLLTHIHTAHACSDSVHAADHDRVVWQTYSHRRCHRLPGE